MKENKSKTAYAKHTHQITCLDLVKYSILGQLELTLKHLNCP